MSMQYEAPLYWPTVIPDDLRFGVNPLHLPSCSLCGALVLNTVAHDGWHAQMWVALLGTAVGTDERNRRS